MKCLFLRLILFLYFCSDSASDGETSTTAMETELSLPEGKVIFFYSLAPREILIGICD